MALDKEGEGMLRIFQTLESQVEDLEETIHEIGEQIERRRERLNQEADNLDALRRKFDRLIG